MPVFLLQTVYILLSAKSNYYELFSRFLIFAETKGDGFFKADGRSESSKNWWQEKSKANLDDPPPKDFGKRWREPPKDDDEGTVAAIIHCVALYLLPRICTVYHCSYVLPSLFQMKTLGKRSTLKRGEIAKKIKGADGNVVQKYPTLRVIIVSTFSHLKILKFWILPDFPMNK